MKVSSVKYLGIRYSLVPLAVGMMLGACDYQGEPAPANGIIKETMTIEYDFIPGFDAGRDDKAHPEIRLNTQAAFAQTGTSFLPYRDDAHPLPYYNSGDPNSRFPNNDNLLRIYAKANRHRIEGTYMHYHYLSINYFELNVAVLNVGGASVSGPDNQTPTPEEERYSLLFWGDILAKISNLAEIRAVAVWYSTHELGHQRVGLTHFSKTNGYHNSAQEYCLMQAVRQDVPADKQLNPEFCNDGDANDSNSCRDWLKKANP